MFEIFNRVGSRLSASDSGRIWPLFFHQIEHILKRPSKHRRLILTSPDPHSLTRWLNALFRDADYFTTDNLSPHLTSAAKILAFMYLMPEEKKAYLVSVREHFGEARAAAQRENLATT